MFKKITAFFTAAATFLCVLLNIPCYAGGKALDLDRFTLVWSDEFDGDSVDESVWTGHYVWGGTEIRRGGYWNKKMASVSDGTLKIRTEYLPDGLDGGPAGYYSYGMDTRKSFVTPGLRRAACWMACSMATRTSSRSTPRSRSIKVTTACRLSFMAIFSLSFFCQKSKNLTATWHKPP